MRSIFITEIWQKVYFSDFNFEVGRRCPTYDRDVVSYCYLCICNFCRQSRLTSGGVLCNVCLVACLVTCFWSYTIRSYILPLKWETKRLQLNQETFWQWQCNLNSNFYWDVNLNGKNRSIFNKVRTSGLVVSFIVSQSSYSLGSPGNQWQPPLKSPQEIILELTIAYANWPRENGTGYSANIVSIPR